VYNYIPDLYHSATYKYIYLMHNKTHLIIFLSYIVSRVSIWFRHRLFAFDVVRSFSILHHFTLQGYILRCRHHAFCNILSGHYLIKQFIVSNKVYQRKSSQKCGKFKTLLITRKPKIHSSNLTITSSKVWTSYLKEIQNKMLI